MHVAASRGHLECVESLVENGASLDERNQVCAAPSPPFTYRIPFPFSTQQASQTALHMALARGHIEIALLLLSKGYSAYSFFLSNFPPFVHSCNANVPDQQGDTALHVAAEKGLGQAVQTLCQLGIPVDVQNTQGLSPLHLAARHGHIDIVRCLCLAGANVHLKTNVRGESGIGVDAQQKLFRMG